jgi:Skp family chaperone for outer membrane proteins
MKKTIWSLIFFTYFFISIPQSFSNETYFLDLSYVLNQSEAGKKAQSAMKKEIKSEDEKLKKEEKKLLEEEKSLIAKKNILKNEEYKKSVDELRKKVVDLRKKRNDFLKKISKQQKDQRKKLLENLNPLLLSYMKTKKIKVVLDKKNVLIGENSLDLTQIMLAELNKKIKTLK